MIDRNTAQANQVYRKAQVESATPEKLVMMLYDGAIRKLGSSIADFEQGNEATFLREVPKVQKIVSELMMALDHDAGGEISTNLHRLYEYMIRQLSLGLVRKDMELLTEVKGLIEEIREGWANVIEEVSPAPAEAGSKNSAVESTPVTRGAVADQPAPNVEPIATMPSLNIAG